MSPRAFPHYDFNTELIKVQILITTDYQRVWFRLSSTLAVSYRAERFQWGHCVSSSLTTPCDKQQVGQNKSLQPPKLLHYSSRINIGVTLLLVLQQEI